MSFRDNLQHLRRAQGMTQEQLAMLVGVSRQSVTKWEAERAYPEMDKLMKICDIFGCSLDALVKGDLTDARCAPAPSDPTSGDRVSGRAPTDACGWDRHMRRFAARIGGGVACMLLGTAGATLATAIWGSASSLPAVPVFIGIIAGLSLIIPAGMGHAEFKRAHPVIEDFYTPQDRRAGVVSFARLLVAGIGLIFLGITVTIIQNPEMGPTAAGQDSLMGAQITAGISVGTGLIVYGSILWSRFNLTDYNEESRGVGEDGETGAPHGRRERIEEAIQGVIMVTATIIGLLLLFLGWGSPAGDLFWLCWPIGGLICALVHLIFLILPSED